MNSDRLDTYLRNIDRTIYNVVKQVPHSSHCLYRCHFNFSLKCLSSLIGQALAWPNVSPYCHRLTDMMIDFARAEAGRAVICVKKALPPVSAPSHSPDIITASRPGIQNVIRSQGFHTKRLDLENCNPLNTKRRLLYLKTQSVPRCKYLPPRLQKPVIDCWLGEIYLFLLR